MLYTRAEKRDYLRGYAKGYEISMFDRRGIQKLDPADVSPLANGIRAGFEAHEKDWALETQKSFAWASNADYSPPRVFKAMVPA